MEYQVSAKYLPQYLADPVLFAQDQLNIKPYPEQAELLREVIKNRKWTTWRSGHGPGKSTGLGMLVLTWLYLFPDARAICTAPKKEQIFDTLWGECARILNHSNLEQDLIWSKTKIWLRDREQTCFAIARTSRTPEAMAGHHAINLLYIFDEASGVEDSTFEVVEGTQTTEGGVIVLAGNPTQTQGYFFDSHNKDKDNWYLIHTSVENHPNVKPDYAARMKQKWGEDSDIYRVRVLGEFPIGDPNTFITLPKIYQAINREVVPEGQIALGVDVARYGDDRTVIMARQGNHVFKEHIRLARSSIPDVIGNTLHFLRQIRGKTGYMGDSIIKVDDGGLGGGVTDGLELEAHVHGFKVIACHFGGAGNDEYDDEATIMWANIRDKIEDIQLPDLDIDDLVGDLSKRRYGITLKGKIKIESKQIFKTRIGHSPDYADALCLTFATGKGTIMGEFMFTPSKTDWYH